jgi:two-component system chemotaxis response regulator CheY
MSLTVRILVIDDDALLRSAIRVVLESAGYAVLEAPDGDAGVRLYGEQGADLILVDLYMPARDGLEVIRDVRAQAPEAKIIAMSGGSNLKLNLLEAAAAFGASRTLWKPFVPNELLTAVREVLGARGP